MLGGVSRGQVVRIGEWREDLGVLKRRVQIIDQGDFMPSYHLEVWEKELCGDEHDDVRIGPLLPFSFPFPL